MICRCVCKNAEICYRHNFIICTHMCFVWSWFTGHLYMYHLLDICLENVTNVCKLSYIYPSQPLPTHWPAPLLLAALCSVSCLSLEHWDWFLASYFDSSLPSPGSDCMTGRIGDSKANQDHRLMFRCWWLHWVHSASCCYRQRSWVEEVCAWAVSTALGAGQGGGTA